jgi:hypothetical protein
MKSAFVLVVFVVLTVWVLVASSAVLVVVLGFKVEKKRAKTSEKIDIMFLKVCKLKNDSTKVRPFPMQKKDTISIFNTRRFCYFS